ncbi:hypothetical protein BMW24_002510 [Mycobacterium heckeshornense]|nr:hypothetical protein ACT16_00475 [Mycobacterium heckeshornense]PIJ37970.1 hypothetical protein BMW24_002510 [Mycobacterium heckeshornense]
MVHQLFQVDRQRHGGMHQNRACPGVSDGRVAVGSRTHESIVDCYTLRSSSWSAGVTLTRSV